MSAERCPEEMWDGWHGHICGKPVKRRGLCGVHAAAVERKERNAADKEREKEERSATSAQWVERLARHGITANVGYDGHLVMPGAAAIVAALDAKYGGGT